jgi:hypothetical protein
MISKPLHFFPLWTCFLCMLSGGCKTEDSGPVAPYAGNRTRALGGSFEFYRNFWVAHGVENIGPLVPPEIGGPVGCYFNLPVLLTNATADSVQVDLAPMATEGRRNLSGTGGYLLAPGGSWETQTSMRAPEKIPPAP